MFENVLVGVDGRSNGRDAIALAAQLVSQTGKLTLVNVYGSGGLTLSRTIVAGALKEEREASEKLLEEERTRAGVEADLVSVAAPNPGRGLHEQAEDQGADLMVVGSSSRGALGRVVLGDDTRAALNGASCAVAVASLGYAGKVRPIVRVGVGYNRSPESEAALAVARELAGRTNGTVHALEVVSIPAYAYSGMAIPDAGEGIEALLEEASNRMAGLAANTSLEGMPDVEGEAVVGMTGEELAALGDRVDMLVVGSRSYGPWKRLILGSTSGYLQRHARCPLLVLPRVATSDSQ